MPGAVVTPEELFGLGPTLRDHRLKGCEIDGFIAAASIKAAAAPQSGGGEIQRIAGNAVRNGTGPQSAPRISR